MNGTTDFLTGHSINCSSSRSPYPTVPMLLNLDVWHEITSYFEYPRDKQTLVSLAVTSRCLSNLALDVVWRNGERSLTIVHVINSFASSPNGPFLEYVYESVRGGDDSDEDSSSPFDEVVGGWVSFSLFCTRPEN